MPKSIYRHRNPQNSPYYQCVEDHFEIFEMVYEDRFERQYGFFRPYVKQVIYRYLDCGIPKNGFARVRCGDCGHEYLLAFSCKRRHFCPSCHQKRVVEFGEWLCREVVKADVDDKIPCILEPELTDKTCRKNWARLIQKIYEVDPLTCAKCQGRMRVIAFIHEKDVIRKILEHLNLWDVKRKPFPRAHAPLIDGFPLYDEPPAPSADEYLTNPDYPAEAYF